MKKTNVFKNGIGIGLFMFVIMSVFYPLITGDKITVRSICIGFIIWNLGGIIFAYFSKIRKK